MRVHNVSLALLNSLVVNYYIHSRVSTSVSMFFVYELPIPLLGMEKKKTLAASAAKLSKKPDDVRERARLEMLIAREIYRPNLDDWTHLTSTFTYGDGDSKAELGEIIRLSKKTW